MITGQIDTARKSKSGKTLGVKVNGAWYSTDKWELQNMVGETITITETNVASLPDGGHITYLNAYVIGESGAATLRVDAPPHHGTTAPPHQSQSRSDLTQHPYDVALLDFIGRCMSGFPWQTSDLVVAKTRMKQCYELGQSILDGSIMHNETGPRRGMPPTPPPPAEEPPPAGDEFDDDIPF